MTLSKNMRALKTVAFYMGYDRMKDDCWLNPIAARMCDRFNGLLNFYT